MSLTNRKLEYSRVIEHRPTFVDSVRTALTQLSQFIVGPEQAVNSVRQQTRSTLMSPAESRRDPELSRFLHALAALPSPEVELIDDGSVPVSLRYNPRLRQQRS